MESREKTTVKQKPRLTVPKAELEQNRFLPNVTIVFNLSNEPR